MQLNFTILITLWQREAFDFSCQPTEGMNSVLLSVLHTQPNTQSMHIFKASRSEKSNIQWLSEQF